MTKDMPLEGLRWNRDSGSALYDAPQMAVLGRAGGGMRIALQSGSRGGAGRERNYWW